MDLFQTSRRQKIIMRVSLCLLALLFLLPIYSAVSNSLKYGGLENYLFVLTEPINGVYFHQYFLNSFFVATFSCLGTLLTSSLAGFAFSKMNFWGSKFIFIAVLLCLAIPGTVLIVPLFYLLKDLHLYNTLWAVIFPEIVLTMPFGVLMCKNYYDSLPKDLIESAYIDGAGIFNTYFRIFLPLSKPCLLNLGVLSVMWSLQDFLLPTMFTTKASLATATVAINTFKGVYGTIGNQLGRYNAALVLIAVPSLILLIVGQKYLIGGVTDGAVKG